VPQKEQGTIENKITKTTQGKLDLVREDEEHGRIAITNYKLLKTDEDLALIEFTPLTGRMHQIRVHSKMLGCPIIGDRKYGDYREKEKMMLHAAFLRIPKSVFGKEIKLKAETPGYFILR